MRSKESRKMVPHVPLAAYAYLRLRPPTAPSMALEQHVGAGRGAEGDAGCSMGSECSKKAPDEVMCNH